MLFGPKRVTVTSPSELDAALETADEIVVSGSRTLREYALRRIGEEEIVNHVLMVREVAPPRAAAERLPPGDGFQGNGNPFNGRRPDFVISEAHSRLDRARVSLAPMAIVALALTGGTTTIAILAFYGGHLVELIEVIKWPAVAVAGIFAGYFLVSRAMSHDRDVEFSWRVSENVSGKLVIKKVRTSAPRRK